MLDQASTILNYGVGNYKVLKEDGHFPCCLFCLVPLLSRGFIKGQAQGKLQLTGCEQDFAQLFSKSEPTSVYQTGYRALLILCLGPKS